MDEKRTSISRKLLAAMAVPVLFVALIAGSRVVEARSDLTRVRDQVRLAEATGGPSTLVAELQDERNITGLEMLGTAELVKLKGVTTSEAARKDTDEALAAFEKYLDGANDQVRDLYLKPFENAQAQLQKARADYDGYEGLKTFAPNDPMTEERKHQYESAMAFYDNYSRIVQFFVEANERTLDRIDDADLRNRATAVASQTVAVDTVSRMARTAALAVIGGGTATPGETTEVAGLYERFNVARRNVIEGLANDPENQKVVEGYFNGRESFSKFPGMVEAYLEKPSMDIVQTLALMQAAAGTIEGPDGEDVAEEPSSTAAWEALESSLAKRADALTGSAQSKVWTNIVLFFLSAGLSIVVAYLIARSISRPLRSLAEQAHEMSTTRLPDAVGQVLDAPVGREVVPPSLAPITVSSRDEVADVAGALTEVQDRALSLAVEQAALRNNFADAFVNLGRRMQGLVLRQLEFITDLEDSETDETNLSNLFKLDHIATRIRRNAESLIVLGGVEKRSTGRMEPMEAVDTVRAALSEVEDYQRVEILAFDDATFPGDVAADVSHIIAELLENGLTYSPPESTVEVSGVLSDQGFLFTIADVGIGMDPDAIAQANRRLSNEERFSSSPSRYLGHSIAGHLAAGVGAQVKVKAGSGRGTVAGVFLPAKLLISPNRTADQV